MVSLQNDFRISLGKEPVTLGLQLASQVAIVVDAAVENNTQPEVRIDHRLL
jgi:hypothetical protein